jgi:hypothetical protein
MRKMRDSACAILESSDDAIISADLKEESLRNTGAQRCRIYEDEALETSCNHHPSVSNEGDEILREAGSR